LQFVKRGERYANEYQTKKNKKQNSIPVYLLFHPTFRVFMILKVTPGISYGSGKRKSNHEKTA
jgi:hypothetical protein